MDSSQAFGLAHLWAQSDAIIRSVGVILLLMSITSWYLILTRALRQLRARRHGDAVERFWQAADLDAGLKLLNESAPDSPFEALAQQGAAAAQHVRRHTHNHTLGATLDADEVITRALRKSIALSTAALESGLTVLASIGSTAPFVGLFGTVWGIMNSFIGIAKSQTTNLAVVAPGIAEALLATALGLVAAIPAVVIYNVFARSITGYKAQVADASAQVLLLVSRDLDLPGNERVAPAKNALELVKGDDIKASVPLKWTSGQWTQFRLSVRKSGTGVRIVAKVWQGDEEPKEAQLQHDESEKLPPGKAGVWGMPFSGTPIRFDDLRITAAP